MHHFLSVIIAFIVTGVPLDFSVLALKQGCEANQFITLGLQTLVQRHTLSLQVNAEHILFC